MSGNNTCSWFFDALFSKHHPCTLRIPDTLVLVTGESRHLLRCDSKGKICTVPRPSVNHFIETIAERYPCGGADYTGLVVVIHAEGKTPQMLTIPEWDNWVKRSTVDNTAIASLALIQCFAGKSRPMENPLKTDKPMPHAVSCNAQILAKYTCRNTKQTIKVLCELANPAILVGSYANESRKTPQYITCKSSGLRELVTRATHAAITQIEGTRGVKIKAASLKFVTGEMEPVLVWGSVEDCMDESLMKFSNRPEDNEEIDLNAAEIVEGYEPFIRKADLCHGDFCVVEDIRKKSIRISKERVMATQVVPFRTIALARLEQKQEVNYFAPQRKVSKDKNKKQERVFHAKRLSGLPQGTADKDNECSNSFVDPNMPKDLDRNYKLAPAVLMGSAFDRMHSTEFYKSVGVCERCFLAYDKITQQRDQITSALLRRLQDKEHMERATKHADSISLARWKKSTADQNVCGLSFKCRLGHAHDGPCNSQVTKEAEAEGIKRVTELLGSRKSIASVKGLPTRAKIDPTLYGVEAGSCQQFPGQKPSEPGPTGKWFKGAVQKKTRRPASAASCRSRSSSKQSSSMAALTANGRCPGNRRRSVSRAEAINRLSQGVPASDDFFTVKPKRVSAGARHPEDGIGSTPRLMASLEQFSREHRSLCSLGLNGHRTTTSAVVRAEIRGHVRAKRGKDVALADLHKIAETAGSSSSLPPHLQEFYSIENGSKEPLAFFSGSVF